MLGMELVMSLGMYVSPQTFLFSHVGEVWGGWVEGERENSQQEKRVFKKSEEVYAN